MNKKYALHSGTIQSRNDGEYHYISTIALISLYGLKEGQFIIWDRFKLSSRQWSEYIHLFPRDDGDYRL